MNIALSLWIILIYIVCLRKHSLYVPFKIIIVYHNSLYLLHQHTIIVINEHLTRD